MPEFSASLNEDQLQIQKWVHDFAESVVRPAGHEWDEREEFPYPIVEEAAQIGLVMKSVPPELLEAEVEGLADRLALVDADLRRPTLAELFGLPPSPGLTNVMVDGTPLETALTKIFGFQPRPFTYW